MTIQDQIDELKKETRELNEKINQLQKQVIIKGSDNKPTRYYPNGAYMDEPKYGKIVWYAEVNGKVRSYEWQNYESDVEMLNLQRMFPTKEACLKSIRRDDLTAKMYRDMRDERINGDWTVTIWSIKKYVPYIDGELKSSDVEFLEPHDFNYKNETFIGDLKALGWTEEELKIVWFRVYA